MEFNSGIDHLIVKLQGFTLRGIHTECPGICSNRSIRPVLLNLINEAMLCLAKPFKYVDLKYIHYHI